MSCYGTNTSPSTQSRRRAAMMIPVIERMARRMGRRLPGHIDRSDLVGAGMVGLAEAIERRRDDGDEDFQAYAISRIRGEMSEHLRRMDPLTRTQRRRVQELSRAEERAKRTMGTLPPPAELATMAGTTERHLVETRAIRDKETTRSFDGLVVGLPAVNDDVEGDLDAARLRDRVRRAVAALPPRMQRALACFDDELTLREIGEELGVSEGRVCQIRKAAVMQLRSTLEAGVAA